MTIRILEHSSHDYDQMIALRIRALLEPIGVPVSYIKRENEKSDLLIGAFEGETIIGCCVLTPKSKDTIQLRQMAVDPEVQGKGVGAAIIAYAENQAREAGFTTLMMHARNPVIGFYQKCGYLIAGEEFFEVGIGHHKMEKFLTH